MDFSVDKARAQKVWFDEDNLWILLTDGRQLSVPKLFFDPFEGATEEELADCQISGGGLGLHWDALDEDLCVPALLLGSPVHKTNTSA